MHFRQTCLCLVPRIVEALLVVFAFKLREPGVQRGLLPQERVTPDVGFQDRVERGRVVADNLEKRRKLRLFWNDDGGNGLPLARRKVS